MTKKELLLNIGGISQTSKMPCGSWSLSAFWCNNGGKLNKIKNSSCYGCYALKGNYIRYKDHMLKSYDKKLNAYNSNTKLFIESFIEYLNRFEKSGYFRWFDSGDLQSYKMLLSIVKIAKNTPNTKHWLPTKEYQLINRYKKEFKDFPVNLCVRVSAPMLDTKLKRFDNTSSIKKDSNLKVNCNSFKNNGKCLDCRLCWDKSIKDITYKYH
jgi:hypothetical protein